MTAASATAVKNVFMLHFLTAALRQSTRYSNAAERRSLPVAAVSPILLKRFVRLGFRHSEEGCREVKG